MNERIRIISLGIYVPNAPIRLYYTTKVWSRFRNFHRTFCTDAPRKKQSYSTPARYEVRSGKRATGQHNHRDRRSVNDRTFGFENCPDFRQGWWKTPSQYVALSCDSESKYSKISWDALAITEKSLSLHHVECSTVRDKRLTHVEKP